MDVVISADALIGGQRLDPESKRLGPIGSQIARDLCTSPDARWRRLVTDPVTSQLAAMATIKYRIPDHIRHAVKARDLLPIPRLPPAPNTSTATTSPHPTGATCPDSLAGCADATTAPKPSPPGKPDATPTPHPRPHLDQPLGRTHRTTAHRYKQDE